MKLDKDHALQNKNNIKTNLKKTLGVKYVY